MAKKSNMKLQIPFLKPIVKVQFAILGTLAATPLLTSFVLLGKQKATLPVSSDSPSITFHWSTTGKTPTLTSKEKFKDGSYANYSDSDLMPILIQEAMDQWNEVRGSYLRFALELDTGDLVINSSDGVNNIVAQSIASASVAAYAAPQIASGSTAISDCDVVVNSISTSTLGFMETMTHELGHCVGLGHPHTNYGSIMSYSRYSTNYRLSADDRAGTIYLYPDPTYTTSNPKELVACGSISGEHRSKPNALILAFLMTPVLISLVLASRNRQA